MIIRYLYHSLYTKLEQEYHNLNLWYFVSFVFGIIYFFYIKSFLPGFFLPFWLFTLASVPLIFLIIYQRVRNLLLFFLFFCIWMFLLGIFTGSFRMYCAWQQSIEKVIVAEIEGDVENIKPTARGYQIVLTNVNSAHSINNVRINIADKLFTDIGYSDRIRLKAKLFPLSYSMLPQSFDFGFYMRLSGIQATGYAMVTPEVIVKRNNKFYDFIQNIRLVIYHRLIEVLGDEEGNFVAAILIGETKAIPPQVATNMRDTGVAHILSVSGLHLSLVAMIFFVASRALLNCSNYIAYNFNVKIIAAIIAILGSFFYLHISGTNIAATRAFIMTLIFIIAIILGRAIYPLRSVVIAAFIILLFLPEYILHPSFQLSFSAVLCLISGYELYIKNSHILGNVTGVFASIKLYVFSNIYSSLLASIVTAPYVIYHFYKFANYSVLMNLIAVPIMSFFMMPLSLFFLLVMPFGIDETVLRLLGWFVNIVIISADYIVQLPFAVWYVGHITPSSLLIFTIGFFWICFWQTRWRFFGLIIISVSLILMYNTQKPDFIYDKRLKIVGVKNKIGELELYAGYKVPKFTVDYWGSWYGQKDVLVHQVEIAKLDNIFEIYGGKNISLNYWNCSSANLLIITSNKLKCNGFQVIPYEQLSKYRQLMLFCNTKESACHMEFSN